MATLDDLTNVGNIYVDNSFTEETTPATSPVTGEALEFGVNAFGDLGANNTLSVAPEDGHAAIVTGVHRGFNDGQHMFFGRGDGSAYDVYVSDAWAYNFSLVPRTQGNYYADTDGTLDVYIEGSTFSNNLLGFGAIHHSNFTGNYDITIKNSRTQYFAMGQGAGYGPDDGTAGNQRYGTITGDVDFFISGLTVSSVGSLHRGAVVGADGSQAHFKGTIENSYFGGYMMGIHQGVDAGGENYQSYADIDITITGSSFAQAFMTLPNQSSATRMRNGELTLHGDVKLTVNNSIMNGLVIGTGRNGTGWQRVGWVEGDIEFKLSGATTGLTYGTKGNVGTGDTPSTVKGTIDSNSVIGDFVMFEVRDNATRDVVHADSVITVTDSTMGNFTYLTTINSSGNTLSTADQLYGAQRLEVTGSTMGNILSSTGSQGNATFDLVFKASETVSAVGTINQWQTLTVNAGANVRATSITNVATITLKGGNLLAAGTVSDVETLSVEDTSLAGDVILISGLSSYEEGNIGSIQINGTEFEYGLFGNQYSFMGGNLVAHLGTTLLVNSNYTNGAVTDLGPTGYTTIANAQAAVTDKDATTIMVYALDTSVDENVFTADVVTKDYSTSFVGDESYDVDFDSVNLVIGDSAADVASANVIGSYTTNINTVSFGNVTGTALASFDHAGTEEGNGIGTFDLTGAQIGDLQATITDSFVGDLKLSDQAASAGSLLVKGSSITNVYGGASGITNDLTGGNAIANVYAEGNGDKIKLAGSSVGTYIAGYSQAGTSVDVLAYNDSIVAETIVVGGNANTIGKIEATIGSGSAETLKIGGDGDTVTGDVDLTLAGGRFSTVSIAENASVAGAINVNLEGGTITAPNSTFYGLIYGASVTGALDGGSQGTSRTLNVLGHAKVQSVTNFDSLNVTGGTLNVASGSGSKSEISTSNSIEISGDILNERTINAGKISAANINNYGAIGTLRQIDNPMEVNLEVSGNLNNYGVVLTSSANIGGNLVNTKKITALGDINVGGAFNNSGDIYFYATSTREGVFTQNGGLKLSNADLVNTGFISAGTLSGVNNLTTSKLYVTGGAEITGNITIAPDAEVCFTNKANSGATALTLGGSITMSDTSSLVVSDVLTTSGTKTITVNVGNLIGANEIVRSGGKVGEAGGLNDWTIKLQGTKAGLYDYVKTDTSVVIYSYEEIYVNSAFNADSKIVVDGNTLVFGKNAFASVADAVAAAKTGSKIIIAGDKTGMDVSAAGFDVVLDDAVVGTVTAKSVTVTSDSTANTIAAASDGLTIDAGALLTVAETIPSGLAIKIDASKGSGSRLVLDVDPSKVALDALQVTIIGKDSYSALVLAGEAAHAGDLFLVSADNSYYIPELYKTVEEVLTPNFVDGDTFDAATGDALFNNVNAFGVRADAVTAAKAVNGTLVIVDNLVNNAHGDPEEGVATAFEVSYVKGGSDQQRAIVGVFDPSDTSIPYVGTGDLSAEIIGSTARGNIYGLARMFDQTGDFTLVVKDTIQRDNGTLYVTGNDASNVINGNVYAEITNSTVRNVIGVYGSVGMEDFNPVDVEIVVKDSTVGSGTGSNDNGFYALNARNTTAANKINANVTIKIHDSQILGALYGIRTADWVADNANIYQASFVSGSITAEVGGTTASDTFRAGDSLPHGANALQTFNVPTTLHIVATEKSAVTRANWVMEWDTIIVDADATLQVNNGMEFTTAYKAPNSPQDNGGQLMQIYVNMSGYAGGTRTVITAGFINTDATMSNISVIGDNDLTGQRMLVYGQNVAFDNYYHLNRVAIFDKADDMYVNTAYSEETSGTTDSSGQDLYYNANAHSAFDGALAYATEWGGTIIVTGGTFDSQSFDGNNVYLRGGEVTSVTMGDRKESTLKVGGGVFATADGSGKSAMQVTGDATLGDASNFTSIDIAKGAQVAFGSVSGSDMTLYANNKITADSLNFSDATITIDVTGYVGKPHTVISTTGGITGAAANVQLVGTDADKFGVKVTDKDIILTTTIKSDTYLNADYTDATTGTILADGTYLEYGFNAFSTAADAVANLGSRKNVLTVTGSTIAEDITLNGANFVMEGGRVEGYIYGCEDDDFSGMNITVNAGSIGGIALTAGDGVYSVSKAAITFGDGVTVDGAIAGAGDTTLVLQGSAKVGGIEDMKQITVSTTSLLEAGYIDLNGGTVFVTGGAVASVEGNLRKIISTEAGITGATYVCDPGLTVYASGKDVYLMDLSHIYFDPTFTEAITGTTMSNGDVLQWGSNAFNDFATALAKVTPNTGTLYVQNYNGDVVNNTTANAVNLDIKGGTIGTFRPISGDRSTAKIYSPITINMDNVRVTAGIDYIMGRGNSWDNVGNSLVYYAPVTVNLSNGRNDDNLRFIGQWATFSGGIKLNLTNWDLRGDFKPVVGDSRAGADNDAHSFIDVTFDNVTVGNAGAKWIALANVTDWGPIDYISLTVKNSTIMTGTGGNNMRVAAFDDGNNDRHGSAVPIFFTVEDSHINGLFSASGLSNNSVASGSYATLTIKGSTSFIKWANWFQELDIAAGTLLTGGTVTFRDGGIVNVDAKGYTGASTLLVSLSDGFANETDGIALNLDQDADKYVLVAGHKGIALWDGNITNLYYNPGYISNNEVVGQFAPTGEVMIKTHTAIIDEEEVVIKGNAYGEEEGYGELVGFEDAKKNLTAGNALYVTGGTFGNPEEELTPLYATIADESATPFVNLVITNGLYGNITIAEDGKTVTGDATLELAGGTYGFAYEYEETVIDPETGEETTVTLTGYTGGNIVGSKDSVGGASTLNVTSGVRVRGDISDFRNVNFSANGRVDGSVTADEVSVSANARVGALTVAKTLTINANNNFTVDGILDAGAVQLVASDYTGPSKVVLTASNMSGFDTSKISVDTTDTFLVKGNDLWLISEDPGNVYISAGFSDGINGTVYNGDLLFFGVNAFTSIDEAILHTNSDYTMYVLDGTYSEVIDLTGLGKVNLQLDGGTFAGFKIGDGADAGNRSTVRITATTSAVNVGSLVGVEGSTIGYRVIANQNATIGSVDGIQYLRFGTNNVSITDTVNYLTTGGELVADLAGYTATAGASILAPTNGINNFIQYVEGETYSNTSVGRNNNPNNYVVFYDEEAKAVKAFPNGNVIVLDSKANSTKYHGQVVEFNGQTTALVNGQNVSTWNFGGLSETIPLDGKLEVKEGYWFSNFFTQPIRTIELTGSTIEWMSAGPNEQADAVRTGDYNFTADNARFQGWAYLGGRGTSANLMGVVVGTVDEETGEVTDGVWNITLTNTTLATGTGDFNVVKYAKVRGGTANVTFDGFQIEGDFQLFNYVSNYEGESLKEVNVTIKDANCPAAKWMGIWDPQEYNQTTVNLTIENTTFTGDDNTLGLFGTHANADWDGEAHVYISGLTMGGRLSGARGHNGDGNVNNILGTRTLHVTGGTSNWVRVTREFTNIEIEDGAVLRGDTILMPGTASEAGIAGFILRGEAGYTGDVKEYAVMGNTVNGLAQDAAQFLDADGNEIEGYKAIVGNTNVFIYKPTGDVYFNNNYSATTTGASITEADGTKNFLVFGDNAVNALGTTAGAYAAMDRRKEAGVKGAAIQVVGAQSNNFYTNGYKTIVNEGTITNLVGGTAGTTIKVDSGEVDPETGEPIMVNEVVPAPNVESVDMTVKKGATVTNVIVASSTSGVTGNALVTIADGVTMNGTLNGGNEFVGGTSDLVFQGGASAKAITAFDNVTLNANNVVTLSGEFSGASITIDATNFTDFTKKVLVAEGGFGEGAISVTVLGEGFGYQFLDEKTLLVTSTLVGNAYANTEWTEADVQGKFVGDMALVWNQNAFSSFAAAANAVGEGSVIEFTGGNSSEDVTVTKKNDVLISANTTGTALGALTGDGGTLTVDTDFTATSISGFSGINLKAVDNITVGSMAFEEGGTLTIDMTGYTQEATDAAVLTVAGGITGLSDENIKFVGDGSGVYHAYYSHIDNSVHAMRIDNFYVDTAFGTAGENIVEGATNAITGETLLWGVNAFYYLNNALDKMAPGQYLYINNRAGNNIATRGEFTNIYLTNSTVPVIVNGYTSGDQTYVGDVSMTIKDSTIATANGSFLFGTVTVGEPWNHNQHVFGSLTVDVIGSTVGGDTGAILLTGFSFVNVYGTEEDPAMITFNFVDSIIRDDILFIGDSPVGKTEVIDGQTYTQANLEINFENVVVPEDKWWRIQDGDQNSEGTVTVNIKNSSFGDNRHGMRFSLGDWSQATPRSQSDFIFNLENTKFTGYLNAGRADNDHSELPGYTGNKVLNLAGANDIYYTYWFNELNMTADATLTGHTLRMASAGGAINIDVTGYTGCSKVFIVTENAFENVTVADINVIGLDPENPQYTLLTDYDETAETPALTTVVLKGAVKDIYVSSEYTAEDLKLGASYNGEALFFGENAFATAEAGIAALTAEGATLYISGGKVKTAALPANSLTIDATAQLTYNGDTVITIAGDVVNEGTFVISAGGFIDGTTTDILVLTANSISGDGIFRTDNSGYTVNVVGNEVHLLMKKLDVYVNTAWEGLEADAIVDIPGGTAVIGSDAFATADAAAAAVSANGSITILASDVKFSSPIVRTVTATEGSTVQEAAVGTGTAVGSLTLQSGAVATAASVRAKGTLTVEAGAKVTGGLGMLAGAAVSFAEGSILDIDISAQNAGDSASVTNYSILTGTPTITITIAAGQADGTYALATDAASFSSNATLQTSSATIGELVFGETVTFDGIEYTLALDDNNVLNLTKQVYVAPITVTYVNNGWASLVDGDVVTVSGGTAIYGYDAFATGDAAIAAVISYGEVKVVGGTVSFTDAIDKTVSVSADATLVGKAAIATAITVDGTIAFDTQFATAEAAQIAGLASVSGATKYTLTGASSAGTYLLATDAGSFNSEIMFGSYTLKVGDTVIVNDALAYTLVLDEGTLAVTVAEYTPPAPETPVQAYVNSEWTGKNVGDTVTVGDKTATIGYDAFALLDAAIAGTTDDGKINVVGGEITFGAYSKTITVDAGATVVGKNVFDKAITINGTVAFDIAFATATAAQVSGYSFIAGAATYTLTAATPAEGTYLLASDAATFNSNVTFGNAVLVVGAEATTVGDYTYALSITDNSELALTIAEKPVPPTPTELTQAYVNSEWAGVPAGTVIGGATIGYDGFATIGEAEAAVTDDGKVNVVGGEITFGAYSKTITVDAGATVVGKNVFDKAITINGTVAFDTAFATAEAAQVSGYSFIAGAASYTLTVATPAVGTYLLASDAAAFNSAVTFGAVTLTVGAEATVVGDFTYALGITDNNALALTIAEFVPPTPTVDYVYVNSDWSTLSIGDTVTIGDVTATIGTDAFASGDIAIASVTDDGTVEVVANEVSFTKAIGKSVVIDATATLIGKATFEKTITINGTVAFDTAFATAEAAQFGGFSFVTGDASYTLSAAPTVGTYLLASDAATFNSAVAYGDVTLTVGAEAVEIGDYTYALAITDNSELALTIAEKPVPPTPTELTQAYANSDWAGVTPGTVIGGATIGYDGFVTLGEAEAAVTADGKVNVVGGEITFGAYSKTITVDAGATVVGKNVFDKAITINGTVAFDIAFATATAAQVSGYSFIAGAATYTLTAAAPAVGTYLLASDAAAFNSAVAFGDVTLTVGAEAVEIGDFTYALGITDNNDLALVIATKPVPPTPTQSTVYVNTEWVNLPAGTTVTIGDVTATIGVDAFANADDAAKAVSEDGQIEVVGGVVSFTAPITEPVTIDAGATLAGKATFEADITVNGTIAFDTVSAGDAPQFVGFDKVTLGEGATLTLAAEAKEAGSSVVLATDAEDLYKATVASETFEYTVGAPEFSVVNGVSYVLDLDDEQNLVLSYVACENKADDGWNNYLADKKLGINYAVVESKGNAVEDFSNVLLDTKGTVFENGKYNFVSSADTADYAKITLTSAAKLIFSVDATDKVKFSVFSLDLGKGKAKSLKAFTGTQGVTKEVYVEAGEYYVAVENKNKKSAATFYNVSLSESSIIYSDADDGLNNYLYDKKQGGLNKHVDEFASTDVVSGTTDIQLDLEEPTGKEGYSNWVGFGDVTDFAKISMDSPAALKFSVTATDDAKLVVYSMTMDAKGNWKMKAVDTVTLSYKKGNTAQSKKVVLLDRLPVNEKDVNGVTGYYVSVTSTNAKKGGNAYYNVSASGVTYDDADTGANSWGYDKKANVVNTDIEFNEISAESEIFLDNNVSGDYSNFVGFGDEYDYAELAVMESGKYSFTIDVAGDTGKGKFTVYSLTWNEKKHAYTQKAILTQTIKDLHGAVTKEVDLVAGSDVRYLVSMQSTDAKKGTELYYNVTAKMTSAANSSALDSALLTSSVDTFADASAFIADSQLVDEKQAWQSVASLA